MKKSPFVLLAAIALGTTASAQIAGPSSGTPVLTPQGGAGAQGAKLMKIRQEILAKLNLTADQKAKLASHEKEATAKRRELFQGAQGDPTAMREKMQAMQKENESFMKGLLTSDQYKQFLALRREAFKDIPRNGALQGGPGLKRP